MDDCITVTYPCGCEVDFEESCDIFDECPLCDHYMFEVEVESDYQERMEERRQMGLGNF